MKFVVCPHCKNYRIVTSDVPKEVVVVMPCPSCQEWVVLFRNRVIAVNRRIIQSGTMDERKNHLAEVIAEFLDEEFFAQGLPEEADFLDAEDEAGEPSLDQGAPEFFGEGTKPPRPRRARRTKDGGPQPITDQEIERFVKLDLQRIDDAAYFREHFGQ